MKIPAPGNFDAIHPVLLVHRLWVIRINVATDVVSAHDFAIPNVFDCLNRRLRQWTNDNLRARNARSDKRECNECEIFHDQNVDVEFALAAFGSGV